MMKFADSFKKLVPTMEYARCFPIPEPQSKSPPAQTGSPMTQFSYNFALNAGTNSGIGSRLMPGLIPGSPNITSEMIFDWMDVEIFREASRMTRQPCDT